MRHRQPDDVFSGAILFVAALAFLYGCYQLASVGGSW